MVRERFEELARRIDGSQLIAYAFEGKRLRFQLYHPGSSRLYSFDLPTDSVYGRSIPVDPDRSACSIRLVDLGRRLDIRQERYFPPLDPNLVLKDAKDRACLAYGRRCVDCRWLMSLDNGRTLLCCLVLDLEAIQWLVE